MMNPPWFFVMVLQLADEFFTFVCYEQYTLLPELYLTGVKKLTFKEKWDG